MISPGTVITIQPAANDAFPGLELSAHPVLMIGGHDADPDAVPLQPIAATLPDDGGIAVADARTVNVRAFGGDGKLLQTFGMVRVILRMRIGHNPRSTTLYEVECTAAGIAKAIVMLDSTKQVVLWHQGQPTEAGIPTGRCT